MCVQDDSWPGVAGLQEEAAAAAPGCWRRVLEGDTSWKDCLPYA